MQKKWEDALELDKMKERLSGRNATSSASEVTHAPRFFLVCVSTLGDVQAKVLIFKEKILAYISQYGVADCINSKVRIKVGRLGVDWVAPCREVWGN